MSYRILRKKPKNPIFPKKPSHFWDSSSFDIVGVPDKPDSALSHEIYETLSDEQLLKTFVYAEYLKRKYFIDCYTHKKNNDYLKTGKTQKYSFIQFWDIDSLIKILSDNLLASENNKGLIINKFNQTSSNYNSILLKNYEQVCKTTHQYSIYNLILYLFDCYYSLFVDIFYHPDFYRRYMSFEDKDFLQKYLNTHEINILLFERILYQISKTMFIENYPENNFGTLVKIFSIIFNNGYKSYFFVIYKKIIDNYNLYLSELYNISNIKDIIDNNYKIINMPKFFFIPQNIKPDLYEYPNVDANLISSLGTLDVRISLNNISLDKISDYFIKILIRPIYSYKQDMQINYSEREVSYIDKLFDSGDIANSNTKSVEIRINSLYIWDKTFLIINDKQPNKLSITSNIKNFLKEKNGKSEKVCNSSIIRNYQRYIKNTTKCIEEGKYQAI